MTNRMKERDTNVFNISFILNTNIKYKEMKTQRNRPEYFMLGLARCTAVEESDRLRSMR